MPRKPSRTSSGNDSSQLSLPLWDPLGATAEPREINPSSTSTEGLPRPDDEEASSSSRSREDSPDQRRQSSAPEADAAPAPGAATAEPGFEATPLAEARAIISDQGLVPGAPSQGADPSTALSELILRFLEFAEAIDRSPHTLQTTRVDLNLLVRFLGDRPASSISLADLRRFATWLRGERHNDSRSLRRKVASVKAFFSFLRREGIRDDDPAEQLVYPSLEPYLPEFLESDEAVRLIAAAERPLWRALIATLLDAGLKRDEVLALHPADVYLDPDDPRRGYLTVRAAKDARRIRARTVPLTSQLTDELRRQIEIGASDRVFPISVRAVNAIVETSGERAGIRKRGPVSPQMLRDTFAVVEVRRRIVEEERARQAGASERDIAGMRLRHDLEVCDLLGLTPGGTNDPIARYRVLVQAGSSSR